MFNVSFCADTDCTEADVSIKLLCIITLVLVNIRLMDRLQMSIYIHGTLYNVHVSLVNSKIDTQINQQLRATPYISHITLLARLPTLRLSFAIHTES